MSSIATIWHYNRWMIIDITRTLQPEIAVWPGDIPFELESCLALDRGDLVNLTNLRLSAHTGTHVDAPLHFRPKTTSIAQLPLEIYWGVAQVVTVDKVGALVSADFDEYDLSLAPRLLLKSRSSKQDPTQFSADFAYPTPEAADFFKQHGIILFGTDAPSVDPFGSTTLEGHQALGRNNILIMEGLSLDGVADGLYELVALPLKIAGGDGCPVRAVLRTIDR